MDKKQLEELLHRYKSGRSTAEERQLLHQYYNNFINKNTLDDFELSKALSQLKKWDVTDHTIKTIIKPDFRWKGVAAALAIFFLTGLSYYFYRSNSATPHLSTEKAAQQTTILGPVSKAIAIIAPGDTLLLDSTNNFGADVAQLHPGSDMFKNQHITLKTPRGGQLQFTLPDGSQVWLNSESSLSYPLIFDKNSRTIAVEGEAYLEVAKVNKSTKMIPFTVRTSTHEIQVLGTKFNIHNYADEDVSRTTLVEGSVKIRSSSQVDETVLKPHQQFVTNGTKSQVISVAADDALLWKEGIISLSNQDLASVIRTISRNYDVTFIDTDLPDGLKMSGELQTNLNIDELLAVLALNLDVKFTRTGKTIQTIKI